MRASELAELMRGWVDQNGDIDVCVDGCEIVDYKYIDTDGLDSFLGLVVAED